MRSHAIYTVASFSLQPRTHNETIIPLLENGMIGASQLITSANRRQIVDIEIERPQVRRLSHHHQRHHQRQLRLR